MPRDLEREVFGGSESELSSDEEEVQQQQQQQQPRRPSKPRDDYDQESSDGGSEDDYVQDRPASAKPKAKRSKKRGDDEEGGSKPAQRKRKRKAPPPEIDYSELPPEQASKMRLDKQIDDILKPKKGSRQRKKRNNDEVLDQFADDEVARLREAMLNAAEEDIKANNEKRPATAKLKLLNEAMDTLRKQSLAQSMIDNNLLDAVRKWLEPLPDKSLPALNIQRELFAVVRKMEFIDTAVLKESYLGRIVLFYTKCKRVTPDIQRIASELVSTWSRPIIKRSASYRDRIIPTADQGSEVQVERLNTILARAKANEKSRVRKNAVMIPQRELGNYTVAPKAIGNLNRANASVDEDIQRRRKTAEKLRYLTRKMTAK